jgi:hypothetical protein
LLNPSELYPVESGYFFYSSDNRYFNIYFTYYDIEYQENEKIRSEEYLMIGVEQIPKVPEIYNNEELAGGDTKPTEEIDIALTTAIKNFFATNPEEILIYLLSTERGKQAARKRRFTRIVDKLGEDITCFNYEFDSEYPDTGFLVLTNNPETDAIEAIFDEYVRQFI